MSRRNGVLIGIGLGVCVVLALFASPWASDAPDGLEKVSADQDLDPSATASAAGEAVLVDTDDGLGFSAAIGVLVTFAVGGGAFLLVKRLTRRRDEVDESDPESGPDRADHHGADPPDPARPSGPARP